MSKEYLYQLYSDATKMHQEITNELKSTPITSPIFSDLISINIHLLRARKEIKDLYKKIYNSSICENQPGTNITLEHVELVFNTD